MKKRKFLSAVLIGALMISTVPFAAFAEDNEPIPDVLVEEGVTYFDAGSEHFEDSTRLFIQDLLSAKNSNIDDTSTAALWQKLGYAIQDDYGAGTDDGKFKTQFDNVLDDVLAIGLGNTDAKEQSVSDGDNTYAVHSSGLNISDSMADAGTDIEKQIFNWYRSAGGGRNAMYGDDGEEENVAVKQNATLANSGNKDDVFWMLTGAFKTSGTNKKGHYQALGVIFSNFTITAVLPEYTDDYYQTTETEPTTNGKSMLSDVKNETAASVTGMQSLAQTNTTTVTSTVNGSENYGLSSAITGGFSGKGMSISGTISVNQSFTEGWTESEATTVTDTKTYQVTVTMPAYTNVLLNQYESKTTTTTSYECPCALNFNVTFVEYTLDPSDNNAPCRSQILGMFESSARSDLYQRAIVEKSIVDADRINWNNLLKNHSGLEDQVKLAATTAPMAGAGATFVVEEDSLTNEVAGLTPIYPLARVAMVNQMQYMTLYPDTVFYVNSIGLEGYNSQNGAYYGFNKLNGHWILLDENGNELTDDSIASLKYDPVSGYTRLVAGEESGKVYLKYLINEDCYTSSSTSGHFTTNDELSKTAIVEVTVIGNDHFSEGRVLVDGELEGIVGDDPISIDDYLNVTVEDATGKEVSHAVEWEARELNGITVDGSMISFSEPGTYHIRAVCDEVYSDWVEVTALPARTLDSVQIPDSLEMAENEHDLSTVPVSMTDQYGDAYESDADVVWTCTSGDGVIDGTTFSVENSGTYTLTATVDGVTSNEMTVEVLSDVDAMIDWGYDNGIIIDETLEAFNGSDTCTRAEAMTFLWRMAGEPEPASTDLAFTDVKDGDWYQTAVAWAVENGITSGTSATTFSPDKVCSRAEIVTFLWNAQGSPQTLSFKTFDDVSADDWYADSVRWAQTYEVTYGTSDNSFSPNLECTRLQILAMLYRTRQIAKF